MGMFTLMQTRQLYNNTAKYCCAFIMKNVHSCSPSKCSHYIILLCIHNGKCPFRSNKYQITLMNARKRTTVKCIHGNLPSIIRMHQNIRKMRRQLWSMLYQRAKSGLSWSCHLPIINDYRADVIYLPWVWLLTHFEILTGI